MPSISRPRIGIGAWPDRIYVASMDLPLTGKRAAVTGANWVIDGGLIKTT
jgi:hypothetical protein